MFWEAVGRGEWQDLGGGLRLASLDLPSVGSQRLDARPPPGLGPWGPRAVTAQWSAIVWRAGRQEEGRQVLSVGSANSTVAVGTSSSVVCTQGRCRGLRGLQELRHGETCGNAWRVSVFTLKRPPARGVPSQHVRKATPALRERGTKNEQE